MFAILIVVYDSLFKRVVGDPEDVAPFHKGMRFSKSGNEVAGASVITICSNGHPPTIRRGVAMVIVNSVYGEVIGVSILDCPLFEGVATVFPFLTDCNSSAAISGVVCGIRVITPLHHVGMDNI